MNLLASINAFRRNRKIKTDNPPLALISFGVMNEAGITAAYADPVTGALIDPVSASPFLGQQTPASQTVYAASGALTIKNGTAVITKSSAAAVMTLAVPTTAQNGTTMVITSTTSQAHTITCPSTIINRGVTGDPVTVITLAAFPGGGVTLQAYAGNWQVIANVLSTFA